VFQCVKVNAESGCHLLHDNTPIFDRMQKWLYDLFQKVSKSFHPLFTVSICGCFQGLFCKPYFSDIPIDNIQEELNLVAEVTNPLLSFLFLLPIHGSGKISFKIRRQNGPTPK